MKNRLTSVAMLSLVLFAGRPRMVMADTYVWFDASPQTAAAGVQVNGAKGVNTVLTCNIGISGDCEWDITMKMMIDPNDTEIESWATDFFTTSPVGHLSVTNFTYLNPTATFNSSVGVTSLGSGPSLLSNANRSDSAFVGLGQGTFDLAVIRIKRLNQLGILSSIVNAIDGPLGWTDILGGTPVLHYASFLPAAQAQLGGGVPVITVTTTPEPMSVAVLLMAATLCRRRSVTVRGAHKGSAAEGRDQVGCV